MATNPITMTPPTNIMILITVGTCFPVSVHSTSWINQMTNVDIIDMAWWM